MSRSKKRQRGEIIRARVTLAEKLAIAEKAKAVGSISALFRIAAMEYMPPKSKVDQQAVVHVLAKIAETNAEAGKQGSNLNQIAFMLNAGRPPETIMGLLTDCLTGVREVQADMLELRHLCMRALGFEAERKIQPIDPKS